MKATLRTLVSVVLCTTFAAAAPPAEPRVVVLDNENLLEGEVTRVGDDYKIRLPVGGDVTMPATRVVAVVANRAAAYVVVSGRADRRDADERLRLANWCARNRLPAEALAEAEAAARMRPTFAKAERLVERLKSMAKFNANGPAKNVVLAKAEVAAKEAVADVPAVDYNSESFPLFATKVHAVLMNACVRCHAGADTKTFRLTAVGGRASISKNMMAALAQINPADPARSPLLMKAVAAHGSADEAPLKTRAHPAFRTLETWVRFARAPEGTAEPEGPPDLEPAEPRKLPDLAAEKLGPVVPATAKVPPPGATVFGQDSKTVPPKPVKTAPADPFDPAIFNGEIRPKK